MTLGQFQHLLVYLFAFLGPLGALLTPSCFPEAFRFYQFFLVLFPFFFLKLRVSQWKMTLAFLPLLFYCILSAFFTHQRPFYEEAYPLFRSFLLLAQTLFMLGAAYCYTGDKKRLIKLYLGGYFLSLVVGYLFFLGYYTQFLSLELIQRFTIETQMEWGLLRFSPGTYPNEYGNISSFALSALLVFFARKKRFLTLLMIIFTFIALLLTTTRAAYLSFFVCLIYLSFQSRAIRRLMTFFSLIGLLILLMLKLYSIDFLQIFIGGIKAINFSEGSVGMRVAAWIKGFLDLNEHLILGNGFGSDIHAHNIYLELLFELGLTGVMVLVVSLIYYLSSYPISLKSFWQERKSLTGMITVVGLIHIFMFALTNHNLHHHLTFFSFLLFNLYLFGYSKEEANASYLRRTEA